MTDPLDRVDSGRTPGWAEWLVRGGGQRSYKVGKRCSLPLSDSVPCIRGLGRGRWGWGVNSGMKHGRWQGRGLGSGLSYEARRGLGDAPAWRVGDQDLLARVDGWDASKAVPNNPGIVSGPLRLN